MSSKEPRPLPKHTPGPWREGGVKELLLNNKCREIVADDGKIGLVYGIRRIMRHGKAVIHQQCKDKP